MPLETPLPAPTFLTLDDASVATYVLQPTREAVADVVLCHGTPWSAQVWSQVAHRLSENHRVFLWDMPGYGRSTMDPAVPVDLPAQMARFAELIAHWGLRDPHVVAHDIGGAVTLGAHLLHGVDYSDLFLWDVVTLDPWGSPFFRLVAEHPEVFPRLPPALHSALVREYIAGAVRHRLPPIDIAALARPWLDAEGQPAFYRQIAALRPAHTHAVAEGLGLVRCPVRIGWGTDDPWIPVQQAHELRVRLPFDPSVIELPDVGHLAPVEDHIGVSAALEEWLVRPAPER